jgi:cytochrome c-type biogenesis protein CcmH
MTTHAAPHLLSARSWPQALRLLRRPATLAALAVLVALAAVWTATFVIAAQPRSLDERMHDVASQLRCPTCNGETAADASTPVAAQMRAVIRQKLAAGESEQQVLADFRASYGDDILASPPPSGFTLFIWLGPALMLLAAGVVVVLAGREWRAMASSPVARGGHVDTDEVAGVNSADSADPAERERLRLLLRRELAEDEGLSPAWEEEGR